VLRIPCCGPFSFSLHSLHRFLLFWLTLANPLGIPLLVFQASPLSCKPGPFTNLNVSQIPILVSPFRFQTLLLFPSKDLQYNSNDNVFFSFCPSFFVSPLFLCSPFTSVNRVPLILTFGKLFFVTWPFYLSPISVSGPLLFYLPSFFEY